MSDLYAELDAEAERSYSSSPFVAIGGSAAVSAVVDEFYRRLLADPQTAGFFTGLVADDGLAALKRHQVLLLAKVLGGPDRYDGRDLGTAHQGLKIDDEAYRRVSLHLLTVLHDNAVPMDVMVAADAVLRDVAGSIVTS